MTLYEPLYNSRARRCNNPQLVQSTGSARPRGSSIHLESLFIEIHVDDTIIPPEVRFYRRSVFEICTNVHGGCLLRFSYPRG